MYTSHYCHVCNALCAILLCVNKAVDNCFVGKFDYVWNLLMRLFLLYASLNFTFSGLLSVNVALCFPNVDIKLLLCICNSNGTLPLLNCAILGGLACTPSKCIIYIYKITIIYNYNFLIFCIFCIKMDRRETGMVIWTTTKINLRNWFKKRHYFITKLHICLK